MRHAPSNRLAEGPLGGCWGPPYNNWKSLHGASVCTLLWYISVVGFVVVFAALSLIAKTWRVVTAFRALVAAFAFEWGFALNTIWNKNVNIIVFTVFWW